MHENYLSLIVILTILVSMNTILQSYSQGPLDELTADQAKLLRENYERLERQEQINSILSVLIPITIGGAIIWFVYRRKKSRKD